MDHFFENYFRKAFLNSRFFYYVYQGEIYRILKKKVNINERKSNAYDDYVIIGEVNYLLDDGEFDESDKFFMDTFKFYSKGKDEYNRTIKQFSSNQFCRQMFSVVEQNASLIESITPSKKAYELESSQTFFSNVFLLKESFDKPVVLSTLKIKFASDTIHFDFDVDSHKKSEMLIRNVNETYRELFFKPIINKTIDKMTEEEKSVIIMYYQS